MSYKVAKLPVGISTHSRFAMSCWLSALPVMSWQVFIAAPYCCGTVVANDFVLSECRFWDLVWSKQLNVQAQLWTF